MKVVFICKTTWEHFVALVEAATLFKNKGIKSSFVVEWAEENSDFIDRISELEFVDQLQVVILNQNKYIKALAFHYRCFFSLKKLLSEYCSDDYKVNLFVDQSVIGQMFIHSGKKVDLYEHGNGNYLVGGYPNYKFIKKILGITAGYGRHDSVENIYLQNPNKSPSDISEKVKKLDLDSNFVNLSEKTKQNIFDVFNVKALDDYANVIILTQPLSEDGMIDESDKISIYQGFIDKYSHVVIKPHPRDKTNYQEKCIGDFVVLESSFPIEILNFTTVRFDTVCTVCSGSAYNFSYPVNVDIYGTIGSERMVSVLGSIRKSYIEKERYMDIEYS